MSRIPDAFGVRGVFTNMVEVPDGMIGKTLGGCRLLRKIGEGGMGAVYLAQHLALNKQVAVKILPASLAQDESRVKRFIREARSAAQLEDSNIVQILNVACQEGLYFIIMQYIDGESLSKRIKQQGRLGVDEATRIILEAAQALAVAHEKGIIHRDIKPENIMLTASGEVKLMDFGLARVRDMVSSLTLPGDVLGTPHYLAPEQARGEGVDGRADIYSLGVTYYYALTGRRPFEGETPLSVIMKHINEPPPDPRHLAPELPSKVYSVLMKMMHKDVKARYQNAAELIRDLQSLLDMAPEITPETITHTPIKEKKVFGLPRTGLIIAGGLMALLLIISGLSLLLRRDNSGRKIPDISTTPKSPSKDTPAIPPDEEAFNTIHKYYSEHPDEHLRNLKTFEAFLAKYPDSKRAPEAKGIIQSLAKELENGLRTRCTKFYHHLVAGEYDEMYQYLVPEIFSDSEAKEKMVTALKLSRFKISEVSIDHIERISGLFGPPRVLVKVTYKYTHPTKGVFSREHQHIWVYKDNNWYFGGPKEPLASEKERPDRTPRR